MRLNKLTPEEEKVIVHKGTEAPFSGEYDNFWEAGTYVCRRCNTPLYHSDSKFDAKCGWPSFDEEISGTVKRTPDPDGIRTEISCAACGAHLGHAFIGEGFTPKNVRQCVNSVSLKFIPNLKNKMAVFGGGCFWCTEAVFKRIKGVISIVSGYAGGQKENPTYEEVSSGATGHAEVIKIEYDYQIISYEDLLNVFFHTHDPTVLNRQGDDVGEQYRSIILYTTEEQKKGAERFITKLRDEKAYENPVVTEIKPFQKFFQAEDYHQNYFEKNHDKRYCQLIISPKIESLQKKFKELLK